jgi:hypothetical protein
MGVREQGHQRPGIGIKEDERFQQIERSEKEEPGQKSIDAFETLVIRKDDKGKEQPQKRYIRYELFHL